MQIQELEARLGDSPVIAAVKSDEELERALASESGVVFVLYGSVVTVPDIVERLKGADKTAFVHVDLIDGLAPREAAIDYICRSSFADGVISTKPALIRYAQEQGLLTVQRFFLLDSIALRNVQRQMEQESADIIEVLPGVMPKVIRQLTAQAKKPLIAGGLIADKEDVMAALGAGAFAISSTNPDVWFL